MNPAVSVIIPVYNHSRYIEKCLNSILSQDDNVIIEIIILDDGSTDNSAEIIREWIAREKFNDNITSIKFFSESNRGISKSTDFLIRNTSHEFVAFLASDDFLTDNSLISRLSLFNDINVDAVFGDSIPINARGEIVGASSMQELGWGTSIVALQSPSLIIPEMILNWNVYGSVLMMRRSALFISPENTIINTNLYSEDMQLYYHFLSRGSLRFVDSHVAYYRLHETNISRNEASRIKIQENIFQSRIWCAHKFNMFYSTLLYLTAYSNFGYIKSSRPSAWNYCLSLSSKLVTKIIYTLYLSHLKIRKINH